MYSSVGCVGLREKQIESQKENTFTLFLKPIKNNPTTLHNPTPKFKDTEIWNGGGDTANVPHVLVCRVEKILCELSIKQI